MGDVDGGRRVVLLPRAASGNRHHNSGGRRLYGDRDRRAAGREREHNGKSESNRGHLRGGCAIKRRTQ
jgi:hypothetical protein